MEGNQEKQGSQNRLNGDGGSEGAQNQQVQGDQSQQGSQGQQSQQDQKQNVDAAEERKKAVDELLKSLGVDDSEQLKSLVDAQKALEDKNLSDVEKKDKEITRLTKELVEEREKRIIAEAKIEGIKLGANKDLIDDLVVVAKSKVTKDKDIIKVMSEMKESKAIYFNVEDEADTSKGTRGKLGAKNTTTGTQGQGKQKEKQQTGIDDFMASLLKKKEKKESPYFK